MTEINSILELYGGQLSLNEILNQEMYLISELKDEKAATVKKQIEEKRNKATGKNITTFVNP